MSAPTPPPEVEAIPSVESFVLSEPSLALNPIERKKGVYGASFLKKVIRDIQQVGCAVDGLCRAPSRILCHHKPWHGEGRAQLACYSNPGQALALPVVHILQS